MIEVVAGERLALWLEQTDETAIGNRRSYPMFQNVEDAEPLERGCDPQVTVVEPGHGLT